MGERRWWESMMAWLWSKYVIGMRNCERINNWLKSYLHGHPFMGFDESSRCVCSVPWMQSGVPRTSDRNSKVTRVNWNCPDTEMHNCIRKRQFVWVETLEANLIGVTSCDNNSLCAHLEVKSLILYWGQSLIPGDSVSPLFGFHYAQFLTETPRAYSVKTI